MRSRARWLIGIPVALVVLVAGGTWFYIHVVEGPAPAKLSLSSSASVTTAGAGSGTTVAAGPFTLAGTWKPTPASQLGYRIKETLFGQSNTAVGRTNAITGDLTIDGTAVKTASFSVDMTKVASDQHQRDGQFQGRIMNTSSFPKATFTLTSPIALPADPGDKQQLSFNATGDLMMHGVTKSVSFMLKAQRKGTTIEVNGEIPVTFDDYGINNPSGGPASTADNGLLEFLVVFQHS
jgi:polyisoprenoid-binding protein YceI